MVSHIAVNSNTSAISGLWEGWLLSVVDPLHTMQSAISGCTECHAYWNSHVSCILKCFVLPFIWIVGVWMSADGIVRGHSGVIELHVHQEWYRSLHLFRSGSIDPISQKYSRKTWNSGAMLCGQTSCVWLFDPVVVDHVADSNCSLIQGASSRARVADGSGNIPFSRNSALMKVELRFADFTFNHCQSPMRLTR